MECFLGIPDPDPVVRGPDPDLLSSSKNSKKNLDIHYPLFCDFFVTFFKLYLLSRSSNFISPLQTVIRYGSIANPDLSDPNLLYVFLDLLDCKKNP
jgi:hypothetical protein